MTFVLRRASPPPRRRAPAARAVAAMSSLLEQELRVAAERLRRPEIVFQEASSRSDWCRQEEEDRASFVPAFRVGLERACVARHASHLLREMLPKVEEVLDTGCLHTIRVEFPRRTLHHVDWLRPGIISGESVEHHRGSTGQHSAYSTYALGGLMPALTAFFAQRSVRVCWRIQNSGQVRLHGGSARQLGKYPIRVAASVEGCPPRDLRRQHPHLRYLLLAMRRQRLQASEGEAVRLTASGAVPRRRSAAASSTGSQNPPAPAAGSAAGADSACESAHSQMVSPAAQGAPPPEEALLPPHSLSAQRLAHIPGAHEDEQVHDDGSDGVSVGAAFRQTFPDDLARMVAEWVPHPDDCALQWLFEYLREERDDLYMPGDLSYLRMEDPITQ